MIGRWHSQEPLGFHEIDSSKIAHLLRGGNLPIAYVYPKGLRETRDHYGGSR
jgi:hypothetical protein